MTEVKLSLKIAKWLTSKEAKEALKVSDCQLMHMRVTGKLVFRKDGNRFLYLFPVSNKDLVL